MVYKVLWRNMRYKSAEEKLVHTIVPPLTCYSSFGAGNNAASGVKQQTSETTISTWNQGPIS